MNVRSPFTVAWVLLLLSAAFAALGVCVGSTGFENLIGP